MQTVRTAVTALAVAIGALTAHVAHAQDRRLLLEGHAGGAWFIDNDPIDHGVLAGGSRYFVTPRLAVGPEVICMRGPGIDRDWFLMGSATYDLMGPSRTVTPYVIASAGLQRTRLAVGTGPYVVKEAAWTGGGGVRISAQGSRWFVAPEFRFGWEPHWRFGVSIGVK